MKKLIIFSLAWCMQVMGQQIEFSASGGMNTERFQKFQDQFHLDTFIETGTYYGETTRTAAPFFSSVYTIELSHELYRALKESFQTYNNVTAIQGYSEVELEKVLVQKGAFSTLIFLDAHGSGGITTSADNDPPLFDELVVIGKHVQKNTVTILDDIRCFRSPMMNPYPTNEHYPSVGNLETYVRTSFPKGFEFAIIGDQALVYNPEVFNDIISAGVKLFTTLFIEEDLDVFQQTAHKLIPTLTSGESQAFLLMSESECRAPMVYYIAALIYNQRGETELAKENFSYARQYGLNSSVAL